ITSIGVDTWGVDFGLISSDGQILGHPCTYRDARTEGMMEIAFRSISKRKIYERTGIQFLPFNTIYQLLSMVHTQDEILKSSGRLLFMPDLFNFLMTGKKYSEYTIATTSQLLNAHTKKWDPLIFSKLQLPRHIMAPVLQPGQMIGKLTPELEQETGLNNIQVVSVGSHDTASAIAAVPGQTPNWAYLSSGTWSLLGVEVEKPVISDLSFQYGFTNEGGIGGRIRLLRNIMGLWLLQRCRQQWREEGEEYVYDELVKMAEAAKPFQCIIDPDHPSFLNPPDMPAAIRTFCHQTGQSEPRSKPEIVRCILESLALKYRYVLELIQLLTKRKIEVLHIVGGGAQNRILNEFTANATHVVVKAGPIEATALGNIIVQGMASGFPAGLDEGRGLIASSFPVITYLPEKSDAWNRVYLNCKKLFS
ncbi:MAG: rhamnulokinase, partial [Candidatus Aminicenantes bacterium]|nr:rhamnulokinase [Candidatus Aminicenantes bacterium]